MNLRSGGRLAAALTVLLFAGCQEDLTAPGSCPANCPGGTPALRDTIIYADSGLDSTFTGYFNRGTAGAGLRVANGLIGATDYGVVRFIGRSDSILVKDTLRTYTIDSVAIEVVLLARDTAVHGVRLALHRLPQGIDTSISFATVDSFVADSTLLDSVTVVDSATTHHRFHFAFQDSTALAKVAIPASDSGRFALAIAISGATPTGMRFGGIGSLSYNPQIITYVTVNIADTTTSVRHQKIFRSPTMSTFVSSTNPASDSTLLTVGTASAARSIIRFTFPPYLRDSALLARATLELTPSAAMQGLPGDSAFLLTSGIKADFGAKSPGTGPAQARALIFGSADTVRVDVVKNVQRWQLTTLPDPSVLFIWMSPEGASYTEPQFYSTRAPLARRPRLHVTYQLPYDFEKP